MLYFMMFVMYLLFYSITSIHKLIFLNYTSSVDIMAKKAGFVVQFMTRAEEAEKKVQELRSDVSVV